MTNIWHHQYPTKQTDKDVKYNFKSNLSASSTNCYFDSKLLWIRAPNSVHQHLLKWKFSSYVFFFFTFFGNNFIIYYLFFHWIIIIHWIKIIMTRNTNPWQPTQPLKSILKMIFNFLMFRQELITKSCQYFFSKLG